MAAYGQRLATRVSNACERCRRQKQRCDPFRPCLNCTNAYCECISVPNPPTPTPQERASKRARKPTGGSSTSLEASQGDSRPGMEPRHTSRTRDEPSDHGSSQPDTSAGMSSASPWMSDSSWRERSIVSEFGTAESAMDITRRVLQSRSSPQSSGRATFAIPGGEFPARRGSAEEYHSIPDLIGVELPSKEVIDSLLNVYFFTVHWFSLVVYEPSFRQKYHLIASTGFARSVDRPFLLLLLMVLVMSCHYGHGIADEELRRKIDLNDFRARYLKVVRNNFMDLLDEDSIEFVQICTLLGSYWLYWGKPRSSFTILGATIKSAQAISLHRQATWRLPRYSPESIEERKRVWWTIYTWDRFATTVYGRPLGISDRDCDVPMPNVFTEHIVDIQTSESADVELSPYQMNLNGVYRIASPLLENIYGIRNPSGTNLAEMVQTVRRIDDAMQAWSRDLPESLQLDKYPDLPINSSLREKMHQLQSLSLRLTHMNLSIIINRPLLADWRRRKYKRASANEEDLDPRSTSNVADEQASDKSFEQCLAAALSVSRLGQNKPRLVQLAGKTHLLSFFAMNVFTASVVLFICALSDTLSDAAQEAKRGMSRNLRILKSLSNAGSLSSQCSIIIEDLIQMIFEKEKEQMLMGSQDEETSTEGKNRDPGVQNGQEYQVAYHDHAYNSGGSQAQASDPQGKRNWDTYSGDSGATLGRTMEQLHRVLKDASYNRVQQRMDVTSHPANYDEQLANTQMPGFTWPVTNPWDTGQAFGTEAYAPDMNQFWLWDMDIGGEDMTSWSAPNRGF